MRKFEITQTVDNNLEMVHRISFDGKSTHVRVSKEAIQDLKALHGVDMVAEVISALKDEIRVEVPDITDEELAQLDTLL
jgi:isopentenyl diphosphate isomerase/L-lactate dehydrogenase-like FMN-dependent dehydrogenase